MIIPISEIKNIRISNFDYPLPDEMIARHPLAKRDSCRLLVVDGCSGPDSMRHCSFSDLDALLEPDSLLVCNDTRVINARIRFRKDTGSNIEVFLLEPVRPRDYVQIFQTRGECEWSCLIGNLKRWKKGSLTKCLETERGTVTLRAFRVGEREGNAHVVRFEWDDPEITFASVVEAAGFIPIPPYLKRESEASDTEDYQTVYARMQGSVAAPTAGLHFTPELFDALRARKISIVPVTLHVGAGTFQPVKSEEIGGHPMHTEVFSVTAESVRNLRDALKNGRPVTAVGTTSVRTIESLPMLGFQLSAGDDRLHVDQWEAYGHDTDISAERLRVETIGSLEAILKYMEAKGLKSLTASTSIMIAPGFRWRIVDRMVTNFHQPQSTLLLLVSSFLGQTPDGQESLWRKVYDEAIKEKYRFLSYGDACLFTRKS